MPEHAMKYWALSDCEYDTRLSYNSLVYSSVSDYKINVQHND